MGLGTCSVILYGALKGPLYLFSAINVNQNLITRDYLRMCFGTWRPLIKTVVTHAVLPFVDLDLS